MIDYKLVFLEKSGAELLLLLTSVHFKSHVSLVPCGAPLKISGSLNGLISPSSWCCCHSNSTTARVRKILGKAEEKTIKTWNERGGGIKKRRRKSRCCSPALLRDCLAALCLSSVRHSSQTTCGLHPCVFRRSSRVRASNSLHLFHLPSHSNCKVTGALNPPRWKNDTSFTPSEPPTIYF